VLSPEPATERICRKCGRCCCVKLEINKEVVLTPYLCPHLDRKTHLCTIYERRAELNPLCTTPEAGIRHGFWPADCPYARSVPGYVGPREATLDEVKKHQALCQATQQLIRKAAIWLHKRAQEEAAPRGPEPGDEAASTQDWELETLNL